MQWGLSPQISVFWVMVLAHFMVLACVTVLANVVVLACAYIIWYMVLACVMLLAFDMSRGPKGHQPEVRAWRAPRLLFENIYIFTFHAEGVVLVNWSGGFALCIEVTYHWCCAVLKTAASRGEVAAAGARLNIVDGTNTFYGTPARNVARNIGILDGTCWSFCCCWWWCWCGFCFCLATYWIYQTIENFHEKLKCSE